MKHKSAENNKHKKHNIESEETYSEKKIKKHRSESKQERRERRKQKKREERHRLAREAREADEQEEAVKNDLASQENFPSPLADNEGLSDMVMQQLIARNSELSTKMKELDQKSELGRSELDQEVEFDKGPDLDQDFELGLNEGLSQEPGSDQTPDPAFRQDHKQRWASSGSQVNGPFSGDEVSQLRAAVEAYQRVHGLTDEEIRNRVWTKTRTRDTFWDDVCPSLPHRTRLSIYKRIKRMYHPFEDRARWTPEQDRQLIELVRTKGSQWSQIGEDMARMPEDCRDRWRNYLKGGENRLTRLWSEDEMKQLQTIVDDMLKEAKDINWTLVSEQLKTRSRIQCRYKWNSMQGG